MASAADDDVHVTHGARIGRYTLLERIGRGATGVVYRARDESMGREVAIKVFASGLDGDPDVRARVQREAEAAAHLSHPNIIHVYDVGEDRARRYIVMELLRGWTLKHYLAQPDAAPLDRRLDLMIQLCAGLGAAHDASICHRDIKPGNVFVRTDRLLKILDFGVARFPRAGATRAGAIVGTPDYMSPEQVRGADVDRRSDIFAAGGVFYYMLTGRKPFPAGDLPTLFHQIQRVDPPPIDTGAPAELVAVVLKALSKDRGARYQTCSEMSADLDAIRRVYAPPVSEHDDTQLDHNRTPSSIWTATTDDLAGRDEDTVDLAPSTGLDPGDPTPLAPRTWWPAGIGRGLDRVMAGVRGRWRDGLRTARGRQGATRKR